jgi:hypothetical protein
MAEAPVDGPALMGAEQCPPKRHLPLETTDEIVRVAGMSLDITHPVFEQMAEFNALIRLEGGLPATMTGVVPAEGTPPCQKPSP